MNMESKVQRDENVCGSGHTHLTDFFLSIFCALGRICRRNQGMCVWEREREMEEGVGEIFLQFLEIKQTT